MLASILIPTADVASQSKDLLDGLLYSIESQDLHKDRAVIIGFDACSEEFKEFFILKYPFIHPIINDGNRLRFAANSNRLLRFAHKQLISDVVIVNQDTILPFNFNKLTGEGIVSPQQVTITEEIPNNIEGVKEILKTLNSQQIDQEERIKHTKVTGFCLFINKNVMDKIGYLDERYISAFEDDDIVLRAQLAGFPVETVSVRVQHYVSKSGEDYLQRLGQTFGIYKCKWSIPGDIEHLDCIPWSLKNHTWLEEMRIN